jgi:hypothetical protein
MTQSLVLSNPSQSIFPSESEWKMLKEQAEMVVKTGFLPQAVNTPEKAITIALKGRELGIPPMQAYSHIHVIQGKPTISAELMLSLIYKNCPGAKVNYLETSDKACEIETTRPGHKPSKFRFTIQDAEKAKLLSKDSWKNYPAAMLRARTVAIVARAIFPDAIMGCSYTPEELGAEIDAEGTVVDIGGAPVIPPSQEPPKSEPPKVEPPKTVIKTRGSLGVQIMEAGTKLRLTKKEIEDWAKDHSGKAASEMSVKEMESFLETLEIEIGRAG